jgi:hypothetical protein
MGFRRGWSGASIDAKYWFYVQYNAEAKTIAVALMVFGFAPLLEGRGAYFY